MGLRNVIIIHLQANTNLKLNRIWKKDKKLLIFLHNKHNFIFATSHIFHALILQKTVWNILNGREGYQPISCSFDVNCQSLNEQGYGFNLVPSIYTTLESYRKKQPNTLKFLQISSVPRACNLIIATTLHKKLSIIHDAQGIFWPTSRILEDYFRCENDSFVGFYREKNVLYYLWVRMEIFRESVECGDFPVFVGKRKTILRWPFFHFEIFFFKCPVWHVLCSCKS